MVNNDNFTIVSDFLCKNNLHVHYERGHRQFIANKRKAKVHHRKNSFKNLLSDYIICA